MLCLTLLTKVDTFYLLSLIHMKIVYVIALILLVVWGLNWGLVGFFGFDLVAAIFGDASVLSRIVYSLVGISAIYVAIAEFTRK